MQGRALHGMSLDGERQLDVLAPRRYTGQGYGLPRGITPSGVQPIEPESTAAACNEHIDRAGARRDLERYCQRRLLTVEACVAAHGSVRERYCIECCGRSRGHGSGGLTAARAWSLHQLIHQRACREDSSNECRQPPVRS
jgi:hypothetical protein